MPEYCEIKVRGRVDAHWAETFAGLQLAYLEGDGTLLAGILPDQSALYGLLERIRDLNLTLLSVTCSGPFTQHSDTKSQGEKGEHSLC